MSLPRLQVSENRRFLVTAQGDPFFWLADTAWELFHRLTREEAAFYFAARQRQKFNVIQAVALAEFDGLNTPNAYSEWPLIDNDPTRPNEAYFAYVDEMIDLAAQHDLYIGLLPTWGDKVNHRQWGVGPVVFTPENAATYGRFLGERYRDRTNLIWILGGDRPAVFEEDDYRPLWRNMAAAIDTATGGAALMTYHPRGGVSTSAWLHDEEWLDFNMMQSGHGSGRDTGVWAMVEHDYNLTPTKPTLDGEPNYEDHPVNPWPKWDAANGYYRDIDVRKQSYRAVFAGGCGITYGHHSIWQFCGPRNPGINHTDRTWWEALERPGANQMQYLRTLMESRPYLTRIPDQSLIVSENGERGEQMRATRDADGSYAMIYLPRTRPVTVNLAPLSRETLRCWWYSPSSGQLSYGGKVRGNEPVILTPPGEGPDWVLVLDDPSQHLLPPGVIEANR